MNAAPDISPTTVASADLVNFLVEQLGVSGQCADIVYMLPTPGWVEKGFSNSWFAFKASLGPYVAEENDCDDFARGAAFLAQLLHHNTRNRPPHCALAFGEFWYQRSDGSGHCINFYIWRNHEEFQLDFYEPQDCSPLQLTDEELKSCNCWRL